MRLLSIFGLVCTLVPFVLSLLCLFAGFRTSFLQNADLMTLNISRIGQTSLFNASDGNKGFFNDLTNIAEGGLNNIFDNLTASITDALDIPDFFTVYLTGYCTGIYLSNTTSTHPEPKVTGCTNHTIGFSFNPTEIIRHTLPNSITLDDLHWPSAIETTEDALRACGTALTFLYILSLFSIGTAIFLAAWKVFFDGRLSALLNRCFDTLAFLAITLASIISTVIIHKGVDVINEAGAVIGIAAQKGIVFVILTWAASGCMLLASILLFF